MSDKAKRWIVKDSEGRIQGPFPSEKILYKIGRGEIGGEEWIATYPGGEWFPISQEPQFYDRLIEALATGGGHSVLDEDLEEEKTSLHGFSHQRASTSENITESEIKSDPVRGRVKRQADEESPVEQVSSQSQENKKENTSQERRKKKREGGSDFVIELTDLGYLIKKEKFKKILLPSSLGLLIIGLAIFFHLEKNSVGERIHLLHLQKTHSSMPKEQLVDRIRRAQKMFAAGNFSQLLQAQNEIVQIIEGDERNAGMVALLCLTYFELWPYAYQDSQDLRAVNIAIQKLSAIDPAGQNFATCQVVDLIVRGRYVEAKNMTETILESYSTTNQPPIPFYYFKAYLLGSGSESTTAIGYLNSVQQLSPAWNSPYILEAELQVKKENVAEAAKIYQKVLNQNPHHKVAKIELGLIEMKALNHPDKGLSLIKEALANREVVPTQILSKAYFGLAEIFLARHNNSEALEFAQKAYYYNSSNLGAKNLIVALGGKEKLNSTSVSSQQMVYEGDQFVREGDYNAAQAHYKTAYEIDKTNAMAAFKAAQSLWQLSFSREAIEWLNKAIKSDPKFIDAYVLLADYFTQRYDFLSAAKILAQAQRVVPKSHEVFRGYALVEMRRGNPKGAIGYGTKALTLYQTDVETYVLLAQAFLANNDPTQAFKYAAKAIELDVNSRQAQIEYARSLAGIKGLENGTDYLLKLVNNYPLVVSYRMALGEMYMADEKYSEAIEVFKQVTEIEEKPKKAYLFLGKAQRLHGLMQDALESLLKSAILDPADTEPLFEAGLIYLQIEKPAEAKVQFQRVLRINNNHPSAHYQMGRASLMMNDPNEALKHSEEERKINPNLADAYILAAESYYRMNQHSLCAREYTTAIKLRPQGAETYVKLARCYRLMGNFDMAENMLKTASKYDSGMPEIYRELGEVYLSKGNLVLAAETFNQYFQLNPGTPERALIQRRIEEMARGENQ